MPYYTTVPIILCVIFVTLFLKRDKPRCSRIYMWNCLVAIVFCVCEAVACAPRPAWMPMPVFHTMLVMTYVMGDVLGMIFLNYAYSYINERTPIKKFLFYIPTVLLGLSMLWTLFCTLSGEVFVIENDHLVITGDKPLISLLLNLVVMPYIPLLAFFKRKAIGLKALLALGAFNVVPFVALLKYMLLGGMDYTVVSTAFIVLIVYIFLEKNLMAEKEREQRLEIETAYNMLQNMSHDIRTPMNAMFGFSQLLGMPDGTWSDEEKEKYGLYILNSFNMMDMLVGDISDTAASRHQKFSMTMADVAVNEICRNALMCVELRKYEGVEMYYTTEVDDSYSIHSDGRRIQQVLINYLTNACKHTQKGEIHVHCSTTEIPGRLTFSVADTGEGVPPEKAKEIFKRYTMLNKAVQGTGLGLDIVQMIARNMDALVYLDTNYTGGARFVFALPI